MKIIIASSLLGAAIGGLLVASLPLIAAGFRLFLELSETVQVGLTIVLVCALLGTVVGVSIRSGRSDELYYPDPY